MSPPFRIAYCRTTGLHTQLRLTLIKVLPSLKYILTGCKEFGVYIGWRKYLYECTPIGYVNLWNKKCSYA